MKYPIRRGNKYHAKKINISGEEFDSTKEFNTYCELRILEKAGKISQLRRQVKFVLIPAQYDKDGKCIERECAYIADFTYYDGNGRYVVEDSKGYRTKEYIIKRKLMLSVHGIRIKET